MTATFNGKPLDVLGKLVEKRANAFGMTSRKALTATMMNVLTSLKSSTKKAPMKGKRSMYTLERCNLTAGWLKRGGKIRRVVRDHGGHVDWNVTLHARNLVGQMYVEGEKAVVFKAQLFNENLQNTVYYGIARNEAQMRKYIQEVILGRLLRKESGMAKYAIGTAQAILSDRPNAEKGPHGAKQWREAYAAAKLSVMAASPTKWKSFGSMKFIDNLRYSLNALKNGAQSLDIAVMKAANKTAGLIHLAFVNKGLDEDVKIPFPEVKGVR